MAISALDTADRWFARLSALALAVAGGAFLLVAVSHVVYPGFTEPMEGDVLQHVERAANGRVLYPAPGAEFIALAYMPLYYVAAAPFYWIVGDSLAGPRLLSVICALTSALLVCRIAMRETGSRPVGWLAGAFFCASYRVMDACLFCALPDALLLFWLLLGFWFWAYGKSRQADFAWLLCFTLAFWTKQHGAFFFGAAVLYAIGFRRNALPRWTLIAGLLLGGPAAYRLLGPMLGERFIYHTWTVPGRWEHSWWFSLRRTAFVLACFAPLAAVAAFALARRAASWKPTPLAWFTATGLGTALVTMTAAGSSNNHYVPLLAFLSVIVAMLCYRLATESRPPRLALPLLAAAATSAAVTYVSLRSFRGHHEIPVFAPFAVGVAALGFLLLELLPAWKSKRGMSAAALLVFAQFAVSYYSPFRYLPRPGWQAALAQFRDELAQLDRPPIWVTYGNAPAALTGRKLTRAPSWVALEDIERQQVPIGQIDAVLAPLHERIRNDHGMLIFSDEPLDRVTGWHSLAADVELVRDYGDEFAALRSSADHWFGAGGYPRYLYRVR